FYLAANGTLAGTNDQQLQQIIEEKFVALYGVTMESWTDYRRTGYPALVPPANAVTPVVPRSLFYPQSEIDLNPKNPGQKADLQVRVFWDI
ncbi:MAG: SusD/RagB family nutrient-binding outer membrane lipoprotein, partial [Ferruginibacter sp.]